jgi:hypothetical protein
MEGDAVLLFKFYTFFPAFQYSNTPILQFSGEIGYRQNN